MPTARTVAVAAAGRDRSATGSAAAPWRPDQLVGAGAVAVLAAVALAFPLPATALGAWILRGTPSRDTPRVGCHAPSPGATT